MKKVKMLVCDYEALGLHPYIVLTKSKHPVHMIEGGNYITEDERPTNPASDMGYFGMNQRDYEIFKANLKEVEIEVMEESDYE